MSKHTIYKYPIKEPDVTIELPFGADPVHVNTQEGYIYLWVRVTTDAPTEPRQFHVRGTGQDIDNSWVYIGTVHNSMDLVWHVFEEYPTQNA